MIKKTGLENFNLMQAGIESITAVYKRIYRSLTSEFRKIYKLNREYMNFEEYVSVLDEPIQQSDYEGPEDDIIPGADPTAVSSQEKQAKVQALMQIIQLGTINPMAVTQLYLEAHEIPEPQKYLMQPQPQQDPKQKELELKAQMEQQKAQRDMMIASEKLKMEQASKEQELQMKARMHQLDLQAKQVEASLAGQAAQAKLQAEQAAHQQKMVQQTQQTQLNLATQQATAQQNMQHQQEANKQKLAMNKSKETKPNATSKSK